MRKLESTRIHLLEPTVYWEKKLNINYDTEFIRYKKLCIRKLRKKESRKLDGIYYITYTDWEQKMIATISPLDKSELYEYIHFLNGHTSNSKIFINLSSAFLIPFLLSFFCPYLINFIESFFASNSVSSFAVWIGAILGGFYGFYKSILDAKDDYLHRNFYADLTHIAENYYKKLTESERPSMRNTWPYVENGCTGATTLFSGCQLPADEKTPTVLVLCLHLLHSKQ